ncbi:lysozyme [Kaistia defluvii]|uniref:lysozyme n=1 Tax=Kaistia defluvii TaxID=410841 RepID=UPI002257F044|nr:lysozyme [Kaistia defluvii]MCX5518428.1 lysozyme [Kaistia defluvii]
MTREISGDGIAMVKRFEGFKPKAYLDTGKVLTIGYGHTSDSNYVVRPGAVITEAKAEELLKQDLREAEETVSRLVKVSLNDNQFAALVSFVFNIGEKQFRGSTLLKKLNRGDYAAVPSELLKWVNDNGKRITGLVNRRNAEGGLWVKGAFVSSASVPAAPPKANVLTNPAVLMPAATAAGTVIAAANGPGPIAYAIGAVIVIGAAVAAFHFIRQALQASS